MSSDNIKKILSAIDSSDSTDKSESSVRTVITKVDEGVFDSISNFSDDILDHLPPAIYKITKVHDKWQLVKWRDKFEYNEENFKYGDTLKLLSIAMRCYKTHVNKKKPMGILTYGTPGTGKSILGYLASNRSIELGNAVIFVDGQVPINEVVRYMTTIPNLTIFFDEMDKNYPTNGPDEFNSNKLLTTIGSKETGTTLTIVTANSVAALPRPFLSRASRFYCKFERRNLRTSQIKDICNAVGLTDTQTNSITANVGELNYDSLFTLIDLIKDDDRVNGITPDDLEWLNIETSDGIKLEVKRVIKDGIPLPVESVNLWSEWNMHIRDGSSRMGETLTIPKVEPVNVDTDEIQTYTKDNYTVEYKVNRDQQPVRRKDSYSMDLKLDPIVPVNSTEPTKPNLSKM